MRIKNESFYSFTKYLISELSKLHKNYAAFLFKVFLFNLFELFLNGCIFYRNTNISIAQIVIKGMIDFFSHSFLLSHADGIKFTLKGEVHDGS